MKPNQDSDIVRRLRCAAGHLEAVVKMAEADRPCEQVLQQLTAVNAALRVVGARLILGQTQSSRAIILDSPSPQQLRNELKRLQSLYVILMKNSNHHNEASYE